jgi:hypothetical protein
VSSIEGDPNRALEDQRQRRRSGPTDAHPLTWAEVARRHKWRWVFAVALVLGVAVAIAFVLPT